MRGVLRRLRGLPGERRAVTAVEMALAGPVFLVGLLGLFEFGYLFFVQLLVDQAAQTVARQIQTGQAQGNANQAAFNSNVLCSSLVILPCANVYINMQSVPQNTGFGPSSSYSVPTKNGAVNTAGFNYCNGGPGQLIQVNVVYMAPVFFATLMPNAIGGSLPIYAASAFGDENFSTVVTNPC